MKRSQYVSPSADLSPESVVSMIRYTFSQKRRQPTAYIEEKYLVVFPRTYDMVYDRICERMGGPCRAAKMTSKSTGDRYVYFTPHGHDGPSKLPKGESPYRVSRIILRNTGSNLVS